METDTLTKVADIFDILVKLTVLVGTVVAVVKFYKYREMKQRIQLEIDANLHKLESPVEIASFNWDEHGERQVTAARKCTQAIEILLKFTNKGFTRMRLYNIQVWVSTLPPLSKDPFKQEDGHLRLTRMFTSGNIVPLYEIKGKPIEKTSFYYIEPGVEQTISYSTLITEPCELVKVSAKFSLEQKRIFPLKDRDKAEDIYPHTASRTYKLGPDGSLIK